MRTWSFDVEIARLVPEPVAERAMAVGAHEAEAMVRAAADEACLVMVTQRDGAAYGDDFYLWLAAGRGIVRRDEHREWYATDPATAAPPAHAQIEFWNEDGTRFTHPAAETVSRSRAVDALAFWLQTGKMLPSLTWA